LTAEKISAPSSSIATDTAHVAFMEQGLGRLCELHDIALDLETNVRTSWALIFFHMTRYWFTM
jgi:hypothetical protein